jgi:hypothetical protein
LRSRIADVFQTITLDEDAHMLIYVEEALRGHAILNVYAPADEQVERIKGILVAHHARTIKYFGRWAITVLHYEAPPEEMRCSMVAEHAQQMNCAPYGVERTDTRKISRVL